MIRLMKSTFFNEQEVKAKLSDFILKADILTMNKTVKQYEKEFAKYQGREYAVMFNSGSSANLALMQAIKNLGLVKTGDQVAFSALTWATNVMPIIQMGFEPVPVDVELSHLNVSKSKFVDVVQKENIKAFFLTNLLGLSGDIAEIKHYCEENNILLFEDSCESLGSEYNFKKLGNFSEASTFSHFVGHHLSTIEGGMVCTDNKKIFDMLLQVRAHGWGRDLDEESHQILKNEHGINDFYSKYSFYNLGFNLRPTEINAFVGLEQLNHVDSIHGKRSEVFQKYQDAVKENKEIESISAEHMNFVSNFAYPVVFKTEESFLKYKELFEENNVEIRPIVAGSIVKQPFFIKEVNKQFDCPNAEKIHKNGFYIPNNPELTNDEIELVVGLLKS